MRSLIADLGDAYCEELRRTRIGRFAVDDADPERLLSLNDALGFIPEVQLEGEQARRASHGAAIEVEQLPIQRATVFRLTDGDGLIALAEPDCERRALKPIVGFRA